MAFSADQIADHNRDLRKADWRPGDPPSFDQRCAVAALVGECESIVASGHLSEPAEQSLRLLIAQTLVAFDMPAKIERPAALALAVYRVAEAAE